MVKKIDRLTKSQEARFSEWTEKWKKIGLKTGETDWITFEKYIRVAYEKAKIPFPDKIIYVASPLVGAFSASISENILNGGAVGVAVSGAVGGAVSNAVDGAVHDAVRGAVGVAAHDAVGGAV